MISALFYDLVQDKAVQIPKQGERRERPITAELVDSVLSRKLDDLEPTLTRHGYA